MNTVELTASNNETIGTSEAKAASRDKLLSDLRALVADSDEYLRTTVGQASEASAAARGKLVASLSAAKAELAETRQGMADKARATAKRTDDYVRQNPWRSIAIIAGAGLIAGLLVGRR